jgi:hypothetical protein
MSGPSQAHSRFHALQRVDKPGRDFVVPPTRASKNRTEIFVAQTKPNESPCVKRFENEMNISNAHLKNGKQPIHDQ